MRGLDPLAISRTTRARTQDAEVFESQRLNLMGMLPINLRRFLADHLGPMLRIEGDSILSLEPHSGDRAIRELARAIRRFSAERARELWRECAVDLTRLAGELTRVPAAQRHVVLCLRCASVSLGPDASARHHEPACFAVELNRSLLGDQAAPNDDVRGLVSQGMRRAIEEFRLTSATTSQPHHDLDCYTANGQMVFTWRPLPSPEQNAPAGGSFVANSLGATTRASTIPIDRQTH